MLTAERAWLKWNELPPSRLWAPHKVLSTPLHINLKALRHFVKLFRRNGKEGELPAAKLKESIFDFASHLHRDLALLIAYVWTQVQFIFNFHCRLNKSTINNKILNKFYLNLFFKFSIKFILKEMYLYSKTCHFQDFRKIYFI